MSRKYDKMPTWTDFEQELLADGHISQEEIIATRACAAITCELIKARNEKKISQRQLEELTGIRQTTITRIESGKNSPSINTLIKMLAPLGKTLAVVPIDTMNEHEPAL